MMYEVFILAHPVYVQAIRVKFVYEGQWVPEKSVKLLPPDVKF